MVYEDVCFVIMSSDKTHIVKIKGRQRCLVSVHDYVDHNPVLTYRTYNIAETNMNAGCIAMKTPDKRSKLLLKLKVFKVHIRVFLIPNQQENA